MAPLLPKVIVSAFFSVIYGGLSYFLFMDLHDAWRWALICGLAAFSLLMLMMLLQDERRARRYARAEKQLPCPPDFRVGANVRAGRQVASVHVYLCNNEVVLIDVHKREPVLTHISRSQLRTAVLVSPVELHLTLMDGRVLLILTPYMEALVRHLRKAGWPVIDKAA